jgi:hypothetical protein
MSIFPSRMLYIPYIQVKTISIPHTNLSDLSIAMMKELNELMPMEMKLVMVSQIISGFFGAHTSSSSVGMVNRIGRVLGVPFFVVRGVNGFLIR